MSLIEHERAITRRYMQLPSVMEPCFFLIWQGTLEKRNQTHQNNGKSHATPKLQQHAHTTER